VASVAGVAGYDYYTGPLGQTTQGVIGALMLGAAGSDLTLAGVRFDDSNIGVVPV